MLDHFIIGNRQSKAASHPDVAYKSQKGPGGRDWPRTLVYQVGFDSIV